MIMKLAVHPDHRGKGIAGDLIQKIVEVLRQAGISEVEINAKMIDEGPVALYERFGSRVAETVSVDDESEDAYFRTMTLRPDRANDRSPLRSKPIAASGSTPAAQDETEPSPRPSGGRSIPAR